MLHVKGLKGMGYKGLFQVGNKKDITLTKF